MSDDPLVMRRDPLTQLPLCPIEGEGGIRGVFLGQDQLKHECLRPGLKRGVDGEVVVWLKKSFVASVLDNKAFKARPTV